MLEAIGRNLWLLLTIIIPGLFTYGLWRLFLVLNPSPFINYHYFETIDDSGLVTTSIVMGIALLQQMVGILIEFVLSIIAKVCENVCPNLNALFNKRFQFASKGLLNQSSSRIIGNCFLSINIFVGLVLLFIYFVWFELLRICHWIPTLLICFMAINLIVIAFRLNNATGVIEHIREQKEKLFS